MRTSNNTGIQSILSRLSQFQLRKPGLVLLLSLLSMMAAGVFAMRLRVDTGFEALLPESSPSVLEQHRVAERTGGGSTLFVVLEGSDSKVLREVGDALVQDLRGVGAPWVTQADDGVFDAVSFLQPRAGLYAGLADLEKLRDQVEARFQYEVGEELGTNLEQDPADVPPPITRESLQTQFGVGAGDMNRFPDGYYQSRDGKTLVVTIRSGVLATDFSEGAEVLSRIRASIDRVNPGSVDPTLTLGITGDLPIGMAQYEAIHRDLTEVGIAGVSMIALVILLFYLRVRMLLALTAVVSVGLAWTFGFTELVLGHLNLATAFLFTIVAGNGINFGILYMARYLEERRAGRDAIDALVLARTATWKQTLTAALAASAAYGSLVVTDFRGFREFGIIGGAGMTLCWLSTYLVLPSLLALIERWLPESAPKATWFGRLRTTGLAFGRPFAALIERAPRTLAIVGVLLTIGAGVMGLRYVRQDPIEYDLAQVQSRPEATAKEERLIGLAKQITGYVGLDGMAILVDRAEQVAPLKAALLARRDAAPAAERPFSDVVSLQDFVPGEQTEKLAVLAQLKKRVLQARRRGSISEADWKQIEPMLPGEGLEPFAIADLPAGLAQNFTERDGTRGRIVYITPTSDTLLDDSHYLFRWADSFRRTELPDGSVVLGSGRAVIYADMWAAIIADIPRAVLASLGATILIVLLAFRGKRSAFAVLGALLMGILCWAGVLAAMHAKLNFMNFIALPITFGIGVDYAVNIVGRDQSVRDPVAVVRTTGSAVLLCSMTTLLGYLALVRSQNFAVRSLGVAAVAGEIACALAAVLVLPAMWVWWRDARAPKHADAQSPPTPSAPARA